MPRGDGVKYGAQLKEYLHPPPLNAHKPHGDRKTGHTVKAQSGWLRITLLPPAALRLMSAALYWLREKEKKKNSQEIRN